MSGCGALPYSPLSRVVHGGAQQSLLSAEREGAVDFRGMLNLFVLLLVALNIRLVVENILKYGWLMALPMSPLPLLQGVREDYQSVYGFFAFLLLFPASTYLVERYVAPRYRLSGTGAGATLVPLALHGAILGAVLYLPYEAVRATKDFCGGAVPLLLASCVYAMKIISYVQVCADLAARRRRADAGSAVPAGAAEVDAAVAEYPECLTLRQWCEFVIFPTLNFQLSYPRTGKIQKRRVMRHVAELVFCGTLIAVLAEQYMKPLLLNAQKDLRRSWSEGHYGTMATVVLERWLKLTVPSLYLWLLGFFALFHCWLNILAELTRFADRRFYDDWWNAVSFRDYWQKWNLPVHKWILRHLYAPMRAAGYSQFVTGTVVFVVSGVIHEYVILVPLHIPLNGVIAGAFISQIPLIALTETQFVKSRPVLGNCLFWFTNCFTGQPAAILIFFLLATDAALVAP